MNEEIKVNELTPEEKLKQIQDMFSPESELDPITKRRIKYSLKKAKYISEKAKDGVAIFYCPDPDFAHLTSEIETVLHNLKNEMDIYRDKIETDRKRLGIIKKNVKGKSVFGFGHTTEKNVNRFMRYAKGLIKGGTITGCYFFDVNPNTLEMETVYSLGKSRIKKEQIRLGSY